MLVSVQFRPKGFSKIFAHVPLSIKYVISRHLIYAGVLLLQLYKQDKGFQFSVDQTGP